VQAASTNGFACGSKMGIFQKGTRTQHITHIKEVTMATASDVSGFGRLEDFIVFAKSGSKFSASVDLQKQLVAQKAHPGHSEEGKDELDMVILSALFTFKVGSDYRKVAKVYMLSSSGASADEAKVDTSIANTRLKEDYKRLRDVNIALDEKFF